MNRSSEKISFPSKGGDESMAISHEILSSSAEMLAGQTMYIRRLWRGSHQAALSMDEALQIPNIGISIDGPMLSGVERRSSNDARSVLELRCYFLWWRVKGIRVSLFCLQVCQGTRDNGANFIDKSIN
jgi:hypothetical protein